MARSGVRLYFRQRQPKSSTVAEERTQSYKFSHTKPHTRGTDSEKDFRDAVITMRRRSSVLIWFLNADFRLLSFPCGCGEYDRVEINKATRLAPTKGSRRPEFLNRDQTVRNIHSFDLQKIHNPSCRGRVLKACWWLFAIDRSWFLAIQQCKFADCEYADYSQ
jgi:hypothetical protein